MVLRIINHPYGYDMKNLVTVFFPSEKIRDEGTDDIEIITKREDDLLTVSARVFDRFEEKSHIVTQSEDVATAMSVLLYGVLSGITGFTPPWGILFGVRPAKLMHRFADEMGESAARDYFINSFLVAPQKADLAIEVMKHENEVIALSRKESFSLYVSIPFCPTRCAYCSFVSHSIEKTDRLVEPYVELLCKELEKTAEVAEKLGLRLETIYFGGGTPTTLSADNLRKLFNVIQNSFDLSTVREYTVEAGRPDSITADKLLALKEAGVNRISINPQTFNDDVLDRIGRRHTSKQTLDSFALARSLGFDNINMDFIAGLPLETADSFKASINKAAELSPESITVHTLALKSSSYLVTRDNAFDFSDRLITAEMVNYAQNKLTENGYYPYYMYRQSKSVGNLENVGWCKPHRDCLYNVYMMDETHSVIAVGAGAVTRLKNQDNGHIDRIYNFKYPYEYIDSFDEVIKRKDSIFDYIG